MAIQIVVLRKLYLKLQIYSQSSDVRSLLGRSLARIKVTHYKGALEDAAHAAGQQMFERLLKTDNI